MCIKLNVDNLKLFWIFVIIKNVAWKSAENDFNYFFIAMLANHWHGEASVY